LLENEPYFADSIQPVIISLFKKGKLHIDAETAEQIDALIVAEYMNEYRNNAA
jgi:hypothetical protein